ncbi:MAG: hypothetical protein IT518_18295 [Burkholderiales bacterium]|nr:hypothetical protein [Burkholderiales bacterium]
MRDTVAAQDGAGLAQGMPSMTRSLPIAWDKEFLMSSHASWVFCLWPVLEATVALSSTTAYAQARANGIECRLAAKAKSNANDTQKRQEQVDAVNEQRNAIRDCRDDRACKAAAMRRYHDRQREIANRAGTNEAKIRKDEISCTNEVRLQALQPKLDTSRDPLQGRAGATTLKDGMDGAYGDPLPAKSGKVYYGDVELAVSTPRGRLIGQVQQGPVSITKGPQRYTWAEGHFVSSSRYEITRLWDRSNNEVPLQQPITVDMR